MAEDLTEYYGDLDIRVRYMHSDIKTLERIEIIRDLRMGVFDVLVGINLLREGLDIPEVSLVAILDADKEGFLRSERSLIQTCGRASRNVNGRVILYADRITGSMRRAMDESRRRRMLQLQYNRRYHITPETIRKDIGAVLGSPYEADYVTIPMAAEEEASYFSPDQLEKVIEELKDKMKKAAKNLAFEEAAMFRDPHQRTGEAGIGTAEWLMAKSTPKHENTPRQKTRQTREKTAATENDRLIPGFHAVRETLRIGRRVLAEIWISEGKRSGRTQEIIQMAEIQRIPLCFKKDSELSGIFPHIAHQGIVGVAKAFAYADFYDIMRLSLKEDPFGLILAVDHITDEGNLGALIRAAAFFGTHGLIIPKDRSAQVTPAVLKTRLGGAPASSHGAGHQPGQSPCRSLGKGILDHRGRRRNGIIHLRFRLETPPGPGSRQRTERAEPIQPKTMSSTGAHSVSGEYGITERICGRRRHPVGNMPTEGQQQFSLPALR